MKVLATLENVTSDVTDNIPINVLKAIDGYVEHGWPPGHFVSAVLRNDLSEAIGRSDDESLNAIGSIVTYVYCAVPSRCWGSREKVDLHLAKGIALLEDAQ